jgi:transcriptional regulator with XRE-family HTH domain
LDFETDFIFTPFYGCRRCLDLLQLVVMYFYNNLTFVRCQAFILTYVSSSGGFMTVCERMFEILTEKKLKSSDLAEFIDVNSGQISVWKKRNTDPPAKHISNICKFLGVSCEYLLTGSDNSLEESNINMNDKELLELFHQLSERQQIKLIGYVERMTEESGNTNFSVAADDTTRSKTGTDSMGK